jgi:hypothetical protein
LTGGSPLAPTLPVPYIKGDDIKTDEIKTDEIKTD